MKPPGADAGGDKVPHAAVRDIMRYAMSGQRAAGTAARTAAKTKDREVRRQGARIQ
jgi:hypothetical protein